ncbi:MAG: glycoside hydrolase family 127 protein, partial [Oscillospiraceae bacterium]|nr:glycoside hydrolase family 127 protein [Oscillospiraceae bacterium]
ERALYNTVLAGLGTDGTSYFYVNPMEVWPEASEKNPARAHVKARRQKWHACACCPPNAARLLASLGKYLYTAEDDTVYIHLYAQSDMTAELSGGPVGLSVRTQYPLDGEVSVTVKTASEMPATLSFRIPGWCEDAAFTLNGDPVEPVIQDGYAYITRPFAAGDTVGIRFDMRPRLVYASTNIRAGAGRVCVQRGPLVYCLEERDNGANLHALRIDGGTDFTETADTIGGMRCVTLTARGYREEDADGRMYTFAPKKRGEQDLTFVPYHLWGNREPGEMLVWVRDA